MRPYGQKRVYGKSGLTRTRRIRPSSRILVTTGVKNHKRERAEERALVRDNLRQEA